MPRDGCICASPPERGRRAIQCQGNPTPLPEGRQVTSPQPECRGRSLPHAVTASARLQSAPVVNHRLRDHRMNAPARGNARYAPPGSAAPVARGAKLKRLFWRRGRHQLPRSANSSLTRSSRQKAPSRSRRCPGSLLHQPCFAAEREQPWIELGETRPATGQARLVENTVSSAAPLPFFHDSTCTTLCRSRAGDQGSAQSFSCFAAISTVATGSSMLCSANRSSRGHGATGISSPSTRRCAKPLPSPTSQDRCRALPVYHQRPGSLHACLCIPSSRGDDRVQRLRLNRHVAGGAILRAELHPQQAQK